MEDRKKTKKQKKFFKIVSYIVNVAVYPVIFMAFVSSFFMTVSRGGKSVTPIFGYGFVRVLTGSMVKSDFLVNDVVIVQTTDPKQLRVGDIIAYYDYNDRTMTNLVSLYKGKTYKDHKYNISGLETDENGVPIYDEALYNKIQNTPVGDFYAENIEKLEVPETRLSTNQAIESSSKVNFHMIVNIYVDQTGTLYFETRGTSNSNSDSYKLREDMVAGRYITTSRQFRDVVKFCSSTIGMLLLVVVPLSIIVFLELLSVFDQISNLLLEKKTLKRSIKITEKEVEKANIGIEMRDYDKAFYYDVMPPDKKQEVFEFLWGCFKDSKNKKEERLYQLALSAISVYEFEKSEKYWQVFVDGQKKQSSKLKFRKAEQAAKDDKYIEVDIIEYSNNEKQLQTAEKIKQEQQIVEDKKDEIEKQLESKEQSLEQEKNVVLTSEQQQATSKPMNYKEIEEVLKRADEIVKRKKQPDDNSDE